MVHFVDNNFPKITSSFVGYFQNITYIVTNDFNKSLVSRLEFIRLLWLWSILLWNISSKLSYKCNQICSAYIKFSWINHQNLDTCWITKMQQTGTLYSRVGINDNLIYRCLNLLALNMSIYLLPTVSHAKIQGVAPRQLCVHTYTWE